jgi:uncharacterized protein (DUF305 family)
MAVALAAFFGVGAGLGLGYFWADRLQTRPVQPSKIDVGFAQAMSVHHQQALLLAQQMLDGRPTPLAPLARNILQTQHFEAGQMHGWLRLWGAPVLPLKPSMDWLLLGKQPLNADLKQYLLACQQSPQGMAGLASPEQLQQLQKLEGRARDALFLKLMQAHHQGGLPMARFAAEEANLPVVRQLAAWVVLEQSEELLRLQQSERAWLETVPTTPRSSP